VRDIRFDFFALALSALAAVGLMVLVGFPAELFERTLDEHYDDVRRWFRMVPAAPAWAQRMPTIVSYAAFVGTAALVVAFLDPGFAFNATGAASYLSGCIVLVVVTLGYALPGMAFVRHRHHEWGFIRVLPLGLLLAAICVAMSRAFHFHPGYVYGLVAGLAYRRRLERDEEGELAAISVAAMLVISLAAWIALQPLTSSAHTFWPTVGQTSLQDIFVAGLETTLVTLVPMRFLMGDKIAAWDRRMWAALFGLTAFAFIHVLVRSGRGYVANDSKDGLMAFTLFGAFALFSLLFWLYFRLHDKEPGEEPEGSGTGPVIVEELG
jgi:hypothetical protein